MWYGYTKICPISSGKVITLSYFCNFFSTQFCISKSPSTAFRFPVTNNKKHVERLILCFIILISLAFIYILMANVFFGATYTQMVGQFNNDFLKLYQPILQNIHLQIKSLVWLQFWGPRTIQHLEAVTTQ